MAKGRDERPPQLALVVGIAGEEHVAVIDGESVADPAAYGKVVTEIGWIAGNALALDRIDCVDEGRWRRLSVRHGDRLWGGMIEPGGHVDDAGMLGVLNAALAAQDAPGRLVAFDPGYHDARGGYAYLTRPQADQYAAHPHARVDDRTARLLSLLWTPAERVGVPLHMHAGEITAIAISKTDGVVASAGSDDAVRLWDLRKHVEREPVPAHVPKAVAFGPGDELFVGTAAGVWRGGRVFGGRRVMSIDIDHEAEYMAVGALDHDRFDPPAWIEVWDLVRDSLIAEWQYDPGNLRVAIAPGGIVGAVSESGAIGMWTATGMRRFVDRVAGAVWGIDFSIDGARMVVGTEDGVIVERESGTGRVLRELRATTGVWDLAYDHSGTRLAVAGGAGVEVFGGSGSVVGLGDGPRAMPTIAALSGAGCVAWLQDGRLVGGCSVGEIGRVYVWNRDALP
jgi:hypothetical protein